MLAKFSVKNFRGFKDKIELDLTRTKNYEFNTNAIKGGIVKNGIIYGPNGSGKSNFGLAIFDIANHLSHKWKKMDYYVNYAFANEKSLVDFEYEFKFGNDVVTYSYSKVAIDLAGVIVKERLSSNGTLIFCNDGTTLTLSKEFSVSEAAIENLLKSANNVSIVNFLIASQPLPKDHVLMKLRDYVENMLFFRSLDSREFIGLKEGGSNIEEYIIANSLVEDFADFLREASNQYFTFSKPNTGDNVLYCTIDGKQIPFLLVASTGTRNLELQFFWLNEMKKASFVFIDEFDAFYHHDLSYAICQRLFEYDIQVFVTTHDTYLLTNDLLRPDCFFILNDNRISAIFDMTSKELRFGHNLERLYRGGTFVL